MPLPVKLGVAGPEKGVNGPSGDDTKHITLQGFGAGGLL